MNKHLKHLKLAEHIATWSKDPSSKFGAVIVDKDGSPVSWGYNGFPRDFEDTEERLNDREFKIAHTIHAEENALLSANRSLEGCVLYVNGPPCSLCVGRMKQKGLSTVVYYDADIEFRRRWKCYEAEDLASEVKIQMIKIDRDYTL